MTLNIGDSYALSIGQTYAIVSDTLAMAKDDRRTVWERIKEALRDKGWDDSQGKAAKLLGISQPSVSEWNRPGVYPKMEHAVELGKKLGVCVEWIYTGRLPKHPGGDDNDDFASTLFDIWKDLSEDVKRDIVGFATVKRSSASPDKKQKTPELS